MSRVRALTTITDLKTNRVHPPGDVWDLDRPADELRRLMHQGLIEILDPAVTPAIIVAEPAPRPAADEED